MCRPLHWIDQTARRLARPGRAGPATLLGALGALDPVPSLLHGFEAHSREFHFGRAAEGRDEDRDHRLSAVGWDVTYLGFESTRRPPETVELVAAILAERRRLLSGEVSP